jgi:hypothetical protein
MSHKIDALKADLAKRAELADRIAAYGAAHKGAYEDARAKLDDLYAAINELLKRGRR